MACDAQEPSLLEHTCLEDLTLAGRLSRDEKKFLRHVFKMAGDDARCVTNKPGAGE